MSHDIYVLLGMGLGLVTIVCLFVVLPWMILHYISKARSSGSLSEEDGRMLEDLWRSAKTMERRIETMERLLEPDATVIRPRPTTTSRGDMN
jgi:phage shock protein B